MIKIMIVDDELIVRNGLKFIIETEFSDVLKIVAIAKTGREAIELFEQERPLIVLMDIQIPGINGIEAIKEIKNINPKIKSVIISAYEQFEYAKQALDIKVYDYLLKPITKDKLKTVLNKIILEIEKEKELKRKEIDIKEKLDKTTSILEYGYINSIIMNTHFTEEIEDYHNLLNIRKDYGYIMIIEFQEEVILADLESRIRNSIKYKCKAVVGPLMGNHIIISVHEDENISNSDQKKNIIHLAKEIQRNLRNILNADIKIGIGSCYKINNFNSSYQEAIKALRLTEKRSVVHIEDAVESFELKDLSTYIHLKNDEEAIVNSIKEGNTCEVERKMKNFFDKIYKGYGNNEKAIKNIIMELMVLIRMTAYREGVISEECNQATYMDDLKNLKEQHNLKNWCIAEAKKTTEAIKLKKENNTSGLISEAKDYIKQNYNEELHLKDVAMAICISPQYLSKIFKDEVGVNFIDYLTTVRIEEAKKMLKEQNISIKEICFKIGYNDPNYFSRLFKKIVGVSPTEYI